MQHNFSFSYAVSFLLSVTTIKNEYKLHRENTKKLGEKRP